MDFGDCLKMLKQGKRMARAGWNGKGMFIYLVEGYNVPTDKWWIKTPAQEPTTAEKEKGFVTILPHIDMMSAQGTRVIGWLASQTDMLADDWEVVL